MTKSRSVRESKVIAEINRKMRRTRLIISGLLLLGILCFAGLLTWLTLGNQAKQTQTAKPTIALVDEDQAATFNGTSYNFGQSFVNLVSNDNKYNWQVVSRSVANRAYSEGAVQAVIYLPQDFSHNILTLQAIDPQKAQVDYKVLNSQSALTTNLLQDKIVNVLYDFNSSIVKMYYASVAGNVASAQTNMSNVVNSQNAILTNLKNNVYGPFQTTNQSYSSVISTATSLKSQNDSWIQAQNGFTNSVVTMLNSDSNVLNTTTLPSLTNYFNIQSNIIGVNKTNANQAIANQADSDQTAYYNQYTTAYNQALKAMKAFDTTDSSGTETGLYADLKTQINDYNDTIAGVHKHIGDEISSLSDNQTKLLSLEQDLYSQFFAQTVNPTAEKTDFTNLETTTNAKTALANLLATSFQPTNKITKIPQDPYESTISSLIENISVDPSDYKPLLSALLSQGSIKQSQIDQINDELGILANYKSEFNLKTTPVDFTAVPASNTTDQTFSKKLTITVPALQKYNLTLQASNGLSASNISIVSAVDQNGKSLNVSDPTFLILDNTTQPSTDSQGNPTTIAATLPMTYTITYNVDLGQATSGTVTATWNNATGDQNNQSVDNFGLIPANSISEYAGGTQFGYITTLLNNINTASSLIAFLYGAPGATYSDMEGITDFQGKADPKSIYKLYGNLDQTQIASQLSATDVNDFLNMGKSNIKKVTDTLDTLASTMDVLTSDQTTLKNNMPSDYFKSISDDLQGWYNDTMTTLNQQYQDWTVNPTGSITEQPWSSYDPNNASNTTNPALYDDYNDAAVPLYNEIKNLVSTTAQQATSTAASAQTIQSNANDFNQMVDTVTQTQQAAQQVIDNTNNLLNTGTGDLKNSQNYYGNFQSILSNTRTNGVNANNIFDFFAQPLTTKNITPKAKSIAQGFDWRWVIVFILGLLLGALVKTWIGRETVVEEEEE